MKLRGTARAGWRFYRGHRLRLALAAGLCIAEAATLLPIAVLVHGIFDHQIRAGDTGGIERSGALISALYLASTGFALAAQRTVITATARATAALRRAVLACLHAAPVAWHDEREAARIHTDVVLETERGERIADSLIAVVRAVAVGVPLVAAAIYVSPALSTVVLLVLPLLLTLGLARRRPIRRRFICWQRASGDFSAHVLTTLRTVRLVRTRSAEAFELERAAELIGDLAAADIRRAWAQRLGVSLQGGLAAVAGTFVLVVGGVSVARRALSLADLLAFYTITAMLLRSAAGASGMAGGLSSAAISLDGVYRLLDHMPTEPPADADAAVPAGATIELRGVRFGHGARPVLDGVDLRIEAGESVAIVGPNGAGKTTLAELVLGLHRPWIGEVLVGGRSTVELDLVRSRRWIGYVPQEAMLRPGTVAENILFGRPEAGALELERAARLAGVDAFARALPDGYATWIGDDGVRLSGGQRQRVAVARALVGRPPILILDEPANHLDAPAVADLLAALANLDPPVTLILITHDPVLADRMDRVARLVDGRIAGAAAGVRA